MKIQYVNRNIKAGFSFAKVFNPIMDYMSKNNDVCSFQVPEYRALPWHFFRNIKFVKQHIKKDYIQINFDENYTNQKSIIIYDVLGQILKSINLLYG